SGEWGGVGVFRLSRRRGAASDLLNLHAAVERLESQERPGAEKAVAAEPFTTDDALEQESPVALLDLAESADRRKGVADQLAVDGDHSCMAGQVGELVEGRVVAHGLLARGTSRIGLG